MTREAGLGDSRAAVVEAIARSAESLLSSSLEDSGPVVLRLLGEAAEAETAAIWSNSLLDGSRQLVHDWSRVPRPGSPPTRHPRGHPDADIPFDVPPGEVLVVGRDTLDHASSAYLAESGIASVARASILVGGQTWGELTIGYREGFEPNASERDSLRTAASCIAGAIELAGARQSLERRDAILAGVAGVAELLIHGRDLDTVMPDALEVLAQASGAHRAVMWEHLHSDGDRHQGRWRWEFTGGEKRPADWEEVEVDADFFESVQRGEVIVITGDAVDAVHRGMLAKAGVAQLLIIPIFAGDRLWGALSQGFVKPGERSPGELDAIRAAASIFGSAIQAGATARALAASEERLRQSEKLEAIGRLAGGVAHDFNNLLTAILGYADLLYAETGSAEARQIVTAATRAASLTRQLLAFSRRQPLHTDVVDLGALVVEVAELVERVIGEDIAVQIEIEPDLGRVMADPGQIHQVLLNLALNGRDAMSSGGRLRIHAGNVDRAPTFLVDTVGRGRLVCISVEDDGVGMDDETLERAFEPFFTTKPPAMGTGLGLSTVHGIVRASGGDVTVESRLGEGTTVRVWLPRVDPPVTATVEAPVGAGRLASGVIALVVEDDEVVRTFAQNALERAGLRVVVAADPISALRRAREETHIDVLVTDVVMPIMNGHELAARIAKIYPDASVLLISGYPSADVLPSPGTHMGFLAKPFAAEELVDAVLATMAPTMAPTAEPADVLAD